MKQIYKNKTTTFKETVTGVVTIDAETPKAFLIDHVEFDDPIWVPKSQVQSVHKQDPLAPEATIVMSKWITEAKGIDDVF